MKLFVISGHTGEPCLMADVLSARRSTLDSDPVVLIDTATNREEYFRPYGYAKREAEEQCDMFIRFVAQEIQYHSDFAEVDEEAGFRYDKDGTIIALSRIRF